MAIRFLIDSTSDITPEETAARGISLVPMEVSFGDVSYRDNLDISHEEFYEKLAAAKNLPTTSQPAPADFLPFFEEAREKGDTLICLLVSAALSGTVQSALLAKEICGYERIYILDSWEATVGLRILVDLGLLLLGEGKTAEEIVAELEAAKKRIRLFALVDTLEYLHKGGRLSAATAVMGTILKVKPLITIQEGKLAVLGKGRGVKDAIRTLLAIAGDDLTRDVRLPVYYGYTRDRDLCEQLKSAVEDKYHAEDAPLYSVGAVIGTHVGPGAAVFGFLAKADADDKEGRTDRG